MLLVACCQLRWLLAVYGYCLVLNYFLYISRFLFLFSLLIKSSYTIKVCLLQWITVPTAYTEKEHIKVVYCAQVLLNLCNSAISKTAQFLIHHFLLVHLTNWQYSFRVLTFQHVMKILCSDTLCFCCKFLLFLVDHRTVFTLLI